MSSPPQTNAEVVAVNGAGVADDWDAPGGPGPVKWVGSARAYYRESTTREQTQGQATTIATKRELIVCIDELDAMGLDLDDVITFRLDTDADDADPRTGTAQSIPRATLAGVPASVQTSRIRLENA